MGGVRWAALAGMEGLESLESLEGVLDELYEDRRSGDARRAGIEEAADVRGVNEPGEA